MTKAPLSNQALSETAPENDGSTSWWFVGFVFLATLVMLLTSARAHAFPDTRKMNCADAHALVLQKGQVRLTFGATPSGYELFDLFNDGNNRCAADEIDQPGWVAALDSPQCLVGYVCRERSNH